MTFRPDLTLRPSLNRPSRAAFAAGAGLTAVLALSACGGADTTTAGHDGMSGMSASAMPSMVPNPPPVGTSQGAATAAHNESDVAFATGMTPHHQQAVEMADLAADKAVNAEVKSLASEIKSAQLPEIATMSGWLRAWGAPVPTTGAHDMGAMGSDSGSMGGMMSAAEMSSLTSASGPAFDRRWLELMVKHHEGAVAMAATETAKGQNEQAKALAAQVTASQTAEITRMRGLLATMAG